jgi:hypothetical protein
VAGEDPEGHNVQVESFKVKKAEHVMHPFGPHCKQFESHTWKASLKFLIPNDFAFDLIVMFTF